jgi:peptidyl-prolyl cis-trans isomerase SurA
MKKAVFFVLLLISAQSAFAQNPNPILFTIDKNPTSTREFVYLFKKNHPSKSDFSEQKIEEYLNLFVNFKLKINEAHLRGYDTTAKFKKELKTYSDELKKPYRAEKDLLNKLTNEAYQNLKYEVKAAHILIQAKQDAAPEDTLKAYNKINDIKTRIQNGEDFEKLAQELSEDPSAKYNNGNLGYFTAMQMVYPFEKVAYQTKVGEVSPIVRTRFGYHIIKVLDKKDARGEVEVSHILLRTSKGNEAKVKDHIFEMYDQLKSGRSWNELVKENSEDNNTKNNGGKLRPFGLNGISSVPEFEAAAFALQKPGEISDPFQSNIGWHIIRLERKIPLPPFSELEAQLKNKVSRDERLKISENLLAVKRKTDLGFKENAEAKSKLINLADSSLLKGKWKIVLSDELKKTNLYTIGGKGFTTGDFVAWVMQHKATSKLSPTGYLTQLYNSFVDEKTDAAEDEKIKKENPDFQYLMSEYREGILLFEIMEKEVWNKASDDSVGQRKYYNEHLDKYKAGSRIEARIFTTPDKTFLEAIKSKIAKGDTLSADDLKKFKSVQSFRKYEKGESKIIDKIDWVVGVQDTSLDGMYYLVDVSKLVAPGTKSFDEARAQVISAYQDVLEKNWVEALKKKYAVKVNAKGKKAITQELLSK